MDKKTVRINSLFEASRLLRNTSKAWGLEDTDREDIIKISKRLYDRAIKLSGNPVAVSQAPVPKLDEENSSL